MSVGSRAQHSASLTSTDAHASNFYRQFSSSHVSGDLLHSTRIFLQSIPFDMRDRTCPCLHTCTIPCTSEISPLPTSLSTVQSHMPNRKFVVATAKLETVPFCFHNSALSCFILNETLDMLQQQETLFRTHKFSLARTIPNRVRAIARVEFWKFSAIYHQMNTEDLSKFNTLNGLPLHCAI